MPPISTKKAARKRRHQALSKAPRQIIADAGVAVEWLQAAEGEESPKSPRFKMVAYTGGKMRPRGFYWDVVVDLKGLDIPSQNMVCLRDHDTDRIVGAHNKAVISGRRVLCEGAVNAGGEDAEEIIRTSQADPPVPWQASIGAQIHPGELKFLDSGEKTQVNGQQITGPCYIVRKATLREISFVVFGGDSKSSATVHAGQSDIPQGVPAMGFEQWLKAQGFDKGQLNKAQLSFLQAQYKALDNGGTEVTETLQAVLEAGVESLAALESTGNNPQGDQQRTVEANSQVETGSTESQIDLNAITQQTSQTAVEAVRQENARIAGITRLCAQFDNPTFQVNGQDVELQAHAISEGWTLEQTELQARRESRPRAPGGHAHSHEGRCTVEALQGAMLLNAGHALDSQHLTTLQAQAIGVPAWLRQGVNAESKQRYMEAAHRFAGMSLYDVCLEAVRIDGRPMSYNQDEMLQAAFSGGTLTKIFTTNVNVGVLQGFMEAEDSTRGWVFENTNVPNFQKREVMRLEKAAGMKKLPRGKTAQHGTRTDTGEEYRIARYAEKLEIDEQDIIDGNDEMIRMFPMELGADARRLRPDLVFAILLSNPTMGDGTVLFHASRGNLNSSAAFSEANLKALITQMAVTQENGVNIDNKPTHLIVPEILSFEAEGLLASRETRPAAASGGTTLNTLQGKVRTLVADSRLDNGVVDPDSETTIAGSETGYYAVNGSRPPIEVGTRRGTGGVPTVRNYMLSEGKWGAGWDVKMDIGAKAIRWRSIHKGDS